MAADDCYVNSEGLNVKRKEHPSEKQNTNAKVTSTTARARMKTATMKNTTSMKVNDHSINNRVDNHERDQGENEEKHRYLHTNDDHGNRNRNGNKNTSTFTPNRPQHSYLLDSVAQVMTESQAHTPLKKQGDNLIALNSPPLNTTSTTTTTATATPTPTTRASVSGGPVYNQTPMRPSIFGDDDDGSVDSDDGNDPILNFIQSSGKHGSGLGLGLGRGLGSGRETYSGQSGSPSKSKPTPKSKDPNRFLADLDARISKDNHNLQEECECDEESQYPPHQQSQSQSQQQSQSQSQSQQQQHNQSQGQGQPPINLLKSFVNTSNKMDWLRNVTQQDIQQSVSQFIPGIGKQNVNQSATTGAELVPLQNQYDSEDDDNDDEEKVHVVQSSALIGDRENAELMKIRQKMNMDFITLGLDIVDKNRNYLWIVVTFFVMMFGYMMTKNKTDDGSI